MKTAAEWFESLPDGYRERAIRATSRLGLLGRYKGLTAALDHAMTPWDETEEGVRFWADVHDWVLGESALPPLPDQPATLPDTGTRTEFATGAVRDGSAGKGLPSLIPPNAIRRMAKRFEDGAVKYPKNNWQKGIPLSRYYDAISRHSMSWLEGDQSEDHLGAIGWNYAAAVWTEDAIKAGRLPQELDDRAYLTPTE